MLDDSLLARAINNVFKLRRGGHLICIINTEILQLLNRREEYTVTNGLFDLEFLRVL